VRPNILGMDEKDAIDSPRPTRRGPHRAAVMVTIRSDTCDKCKNASPVSFRVEPEAAWKTVVLEAGGGFARGASMSRQRRPACATASSTLTG
jgi:hypothetical protein